MQKRIDFEEISEILFKKIKTPNTRLNKKYFIIFVGIPGAGKTTLAKSLAKKYGLVRASTDDIKSYLREENYLFEIKDLFLIQRNIFHKLLSKGVGIISDSNSDLEKYRIILGRMSKRFDYQPITIFLDVDINIAYQRVLQKKNLKKSAVIYREIMNFKKSLEIPRKSIRIDSNKDIKKYSEILLRKCLNLIKKPFLLYLYLILHYNLFLF